MRKHHGHRHHHGNNGLFGHPHDCHRYSLCIHGRCQPRFCPRGQYFLSSTRGEGQCVEGDMQMCRRMKIRHMAADMAETRFSCPTNEMGNFLNGHARDPANCERFYLCVEGNYFGFLCPSGFHWSAQKRHCDIPERAKCHEKYMEVIRPDEDEAEEEPDEEVSGSSGSGEVAPGLSTSGDSPLKLDRSVEELFAEDEEDDSHEHDESHSGHAHHAYGSGSVEPSSIEEVMTYIYVCRHSSLINLLQYTHLINLTQYHSIVF